MFKSIKFCPIIMLVYVCGICYNKKPGRLFREKWGNNLMSYNLVNMTANLCKDAMYKLRMAEKIEEKYKNTLSYELGLLASGIMAKFKHMLRVYRYYSNTEAYTNDRHTVTEVMNAYSVIQSDYNEILTEIDLYLQVLELERLRVEEEEREIAEYSRKNPGLSPQAIRDARQRGIKFPGMKSRRTIISLNDTKTEDDGVLATDSTVNMIPKPKNATDWFKKNNNTAELDYKKKLAYIMWAERWNGYNPEIEGVNVPENVAKLGFANSSNFVWKDLKGNI